MEPYKNPTIIVIGGGFAGLTTVRSLRKAPVRVILIDKTNHHVFQPLLYQVATAALAPGDIAAPLRGLLADQANADTVLGEVVAIDRQERSVTLADGRRFGYDYLVVAPGARHHYFGNDGWEAHSPGLKTLGDALNIRDMILRNLEEAEQRGPAASLAYLNFVVIGGGPTGVELAGAIAEISRKTMMRDFRRITPGMVHVYLVEAMPQVLGTYSADLSEKAREALERLGVKVLTNTRVSNVDADGVVTDNGSIPSKSVIWAAGNQASPLVRAMGADTDRAGRARVTGRLTLPDDDRVFVLGDAAYLEQNGRPVPGVAPAATQMGRYAGAAIGRAVAGQAPPADFRYVDKGSMATIGRAKAIADIKGFRFSGFPAWLMWSLIHVFYLITFRNRVRVFLEWIWYYLTFKGGYRLLIKR